MTAASPELRDEVARYLYQPSGGAVPLARAWQFAAEHPYSDTASNVRFAYQQADHVIAVIAAAMEAARDMGSRVAAPVEPQPREAINPSQGDVEGVDLEGLEKRLLGFVGFYKNGGACDWQMYDPEADIRALLSALRSRSGVGEEGRKASCADTCADGALPVLKRGALPDDGGAG